MESVHSVPLRPRLDRAGSPLVGRVASAFAVIITFAVAAVTSAETAPEANQERDAAEETTLPAGPDFEAVLDLSSVGNPRISPDGTAIAYSTYGVDWENNRYDSEIWLARVGEEPFQLTRTAEKSSADRSGHRTASGSLF